MTIICSTKELTTTLVHMASHQTMKNQYKLTVEFAKSLYKERPWLTGFV